MSHFWSSGTSTSAWTQYQNNGFVVIFDSGAAEDLVGSNIVRDYERRGSLP